MRWLFLLLLLVAVGCSKPAPKPDPTQPPGAHITGVKYEGGKLTEVYISTDDGKYVARKLVWMKAGNKVILPGSVTYDGVDYKINYDWQTISNIWVDNDIEVAK